MGAIQDKVQAISISFMDHGAEAYIFRIRESYTNYEKEVQKSGEDIDVFNRFRDLFTK